MPIFRFFKVLLSGTSHAPLPSSKANIYRFSSIAPSERRIVDIYKNTKMSVVTVNSMIPEIKEIKSEMISNIGTGVVWDFDGHIITNYHVIWPGIFRHAASILLNRVDLKVHLLNSEGVEETYIAKIVGMDFDSDLAVLKISVPKSNLKPIMVEDSTCIEIGQECILIGASRSYRHSLVTGRISGLNRVCRMEGWPPSKGLIQIDASVNPGISGAPVLDYNGHMIAINRAVVLHGIGLCIPSAIVVKTAANLINH